MFLPRNSVHTYVTNITLSVVNSETVFRQEDLTFFTKS